MKEDPKLEQNKQEKALSLLSRSLLTGFIGGVIWSTLGVFLYYFNFSEVAPRSFVLRSWNTAAWTSSWLGDVVSIVMIGIISVAVAFVYYGVLKKIRIMWMGAAYGAILWLIVFYVLQPIFTNISKLTDMNLYTIVSTVCLYIIYGTFIGYSISYDYHDTVMKENQERKSEKSDV
ncbi:YqhR family membrane protein [Virgibacillus byunsanensis]|uniref:YqhR family membrane protein n=1 Tax=Virgibacillus byunsanensis TaxID=570945 RepID=A0ABW3LLY7_9BACI